MGVSKKSLMATFPELKDFMSRFNKQTPKQKTHNLAGGRAYKESTKLELASLLLTSFVTDKFYSTADKQMDRVRELVGGLKDKTFAAKAAIYARTKFNMRSISHVVAGELFRQNPTAPTHGQVWAKNFIRKVVVRPDDATEILSYFENSVMDKSVPAQLKKGLALALGKFDEYGLAKYRGENKDISMVDLVNYVHPKPTAKNAKALKGLVEDTLRNKKTWEAKMTQVGKEVDAEEKEEAKGKVWKDMLAEKELGYFALLRNLRNILTQSPDSIDEACRQLTNKDAIAKSKILPFRYLTALDEIQELFPSAKQRQVLMALNDAVDIACANAPAFSGETLVAVDISGSMTGQVSAIAALFAAILFKANNADVMQFDDSAHYMGNLNPRDSVLTLAQQISASRGGTNFHAIFQTANKAYDRIIILSDMQGWSGYDTPTTSLRVYENKFYCKPMIYSFDLAGHGTLQFHEDRVMAVAGFSDKIFDVMEKLEGDKNALVHEIEAIEI